MLLNGSTADIDNLNSGPDYCCAIIPVEFNDRFRILSYGQVNPRTWGLIDENGNILSVADSNKSTTDHLRLDPIEITVNNAAKYLVVNCAYKLVGYTPKIIKLSTNETRNKIYEEMGLIPNGIVELWKRRVVAAYKNYVAIYESQKIRFSNDCGHTFTDGVSVSEVTLPIKSYHFFDNGCIALFTQKKAYYIESDWSELHEASCYEADGTTSYVPADVENWYTFSDYNERKIVNGQDWYVFGNYVVNGGNDTRKLIWASVDNGHTYKIICEFGSGFEYTVRHVHCVVYYEPEDKYIVATGDSASESYVFTLEYNNGWILQRVAGPSLQYKWASIDFFADELYYSYDNTPGQIRKCTYENIANLDSHEVVLDNTPNDAISIKFGQRGDAIVLLSWWRSNGTLDGAPPQNVCSRMVYYSPNRKDFYPVYLPPIVKNGYTTFSACKPVTADGHLICGAHKSGTTQWNLLPSVYIDECVRKAGFPQAFLPSWAV